MIFILIRNDQLPFIWHNTFSNFMVLMSTFNSTFLRQIFLQNLIFFTDLLYMACTTRKSFLPLPNSSMNFELETAMNTQRVFFLVWIINVCSSQPTGNTGSLDNFNLILYKICRSNVFIDMFKGIFELLIS